MSESFSGSEARRKVGVVVETVADLPDIPVGTPGEVIRARERDVRRWTTKFFNIQNKRFATVISTRCKFTEIYKTDTRTLGNVLDFFGN